MFRPFFKYTKRNPFLPSFYVKNYELIPIVCICIMDVCMFTFWPFYTLFNTDCILSRYSTNPADRLDRLIHPRSTKLLHFTQVLEPNQELYDLYQDMKEAEEEQKKAQENEKENNA
ncbi:uncharacterized protein LOC107398610 [Tribolium castaneum]|uniref:uncharacterized protein LOC107398610 n=1 Tax=Tribolium castaneum TaxID=7070 RepID=UPI00077DD4C4|nr:PREDICTED: uncharacterized protein LOC107398610 [Tribolium castaneum]|eukprot:XP_015838707.1 PREDICTED: uncharacterized protein LOC107398610 [Tribolium castaneum]